MKITLHLPCIAQLYIMHLLNKSTNMYRFLLLIIVLLVLFFVVIAFILFCVYVISQRIALQLPDLSSVCKPSLVISEPSPQRGWWAVQQFVLRGPVTWRPFQLEVIYPMCDIQCVLSGCASPYDQSPLYNVNALKVCDVFMMVVSLITWIQSQIGRTGALL